MIRIYPTERRGRTGRAEIGESRGLVDLLTEKVHRQLQLGRTPSPRRKPSERSEPRRKIDSNKRRSRKERRSKSRERRRSPEKKDRPPVLERRNSHSSNDPTEGSSDDEATVAEASVQMNYPTLPSVEAMNKLYRQVLAIEQYNMRRSRGNRINTLATVMEEEDSDLDERSCSETETMDDLGTSEPSSRGISMGAASSSDYAMLPIVSMPSLMGYRRDESDSGNLSSDDESELDATIGRSSRREYRTRASPPAIDDDPLMGFKAASSAPLGLPQGGDLLGRLSDPPAATLSDLTEPGTKRSILGEMRASLHSMSTSSSSNSGEAVTSKLSQLLTRRKYSRVLVRLDEYPEEARVCGESDQLPLHQACQLLSHSQGRQKVRILNFVITNLVSLHPEACRIRDCSGRLPLHYALEYGAVPATIKTLLAAYPESSAEAGRSRDRKTNELLQMGVAFWQHIHETDTWMEHRGARYQDDDDSSLDQSFR